MEVDVGDGGDRHISADTLRCNNICTNGVATP
jgi:hypothetical protein